MGKITTAVFELGSTTANAYGLWQYDYGQALRIQGLNLPSAVEIHFSLQESGGTSVSRVGVTKDGVTDVIIPDSMLENDDATRNYDMFAFVYLTDDTWSNKGWCHRCNYPGQHAGERRCYKKLRHVRVCLFNR